MDAVSSGPVAWAACSGGGAMKKKVLWFLTAILFVVFCVSACQLFSYYANTAKEDAAFDRLAEQVRAAEPAPSGEPAPSAPPQPQNAVLPGYAALYEENADLFGWVRIADTPLNYPVMHTPEDPEYYLRRAFDRTQSLSGVPFLDGNCREGCGNYLIYGHKMNNGTMFSTLLSYADREFWEQHPVVSFDTLYEQGEYEVLAAFYAKIYSRDQDGVFRYYRYTDLTDQAVFEEYLEQVQDAALYDTSITADYGDTLLTLSTCSYHTENGRFVVVARKTDA